MSNNNIEQYNDSLTSEERIENARRAGVASGEARRSRRSLREELELILESGDNQHDIATALVAKAKEGNTKAFEIIRDTLGEKPANELKLQELLVEREEARTRVQAIDLERAENDLAKDKKFDIFGEWSV